MDGSRYSPRLRHVAVPLVTLALFALGLQPSCKGRDGGASDPASPQGPATLGDLSDPHALGYLAGEIDFDSLDVRTEAPRQAAAAGDVFDLDATDFFTHQPCNDCLQVEAVRNGAAGTLEMDVRLTHPFGLNAGRYDLHAFDARLVMIVPGSTNFPGTTADLNGDGVVAPSEVLSGNVDVVANASGYTSRFDARAEDPMLWGGPRGIAGTMNPYVSYFGDSTEPAFDFQAPVGHNVLAQGASHSRTWVFNVPPAGGTMPFVFVVDAAYGAPGDRQNPVYRLPEFNRKEAWAVSASWADNGLAAGDSLSTAQLDVWVRDWQHGQPVASSWPAADPGELRANSDIAQVAVDIPGVNVADVVSTPLSGSGSAGDPLHFRVTVANDHGAGVGQYQGLVAVRDALCFDPDNDPMALPAGLARTTPLDLADYSTYVVVSVTVGDGQSANLEDPLPYPLIYATSEPVEWSGGVAGVVGNFGWTPADGGNLWRLDPNGTKTNLTNFFRGVVRKPTLNYAGTRLAFGAKVGDGSAPWQVYTMDPSGANLTNVSRNTFNDFDPDWLPDGRLVFASDRDGWFDPYHLDHTSQLYLMNSDGSNVKRLTYSPSGDYWPVVLQDGRISFRRWDNLRVNVEAEYATAHPELPYAFPPDIWFGDVNGCTLWVINPDGTVPDLYYGSHLNRNHRAFMDHSELPDGRLLAANTPFSRTWGSGSLVLLDTSEYDNIEIPVTITEPEAAMDTPSPYGRYRSPARLADGRYAAAFAPGTVWNEDGYEVAQFGLALVDSSGNRRMLVDDPLLWEWMPVELNPRPMPQSLPATDNEAQAWGLWGVANVFLRDAREPESKDPQHIPFPGPGFKVRFYRGVPSTAEGLMDPPLTGDPIVRPHEYLGEAPVNADGSAAAMLPAHVPLTWQLVDASDTVIVTERFYTVVEGGETRFCQGCHAPQRPGAFEEVAFEETQAFANPTDLR